MDEAPAEKMPQRLVNTAAPPPEPSGHSVLGDRSARSRGPLPSSPVHGMSLVLESLTRSVGLLPYFGKLF